VINPDLERWFDRAKLEVYYKEQQAWLEERGDMREAGWFPN
jgi:hypothetical protein